MSANENTVETTKYTLYRVTISEKGKTECSWVFAETHMLAIQQVVDPFGLCTGRKCDQFSAWDEQASITLVKDGQNPFLKLTHTSREQALFAAENQKGFDTDIISIFAPSAEQIEAEQKKTLFDLNLYIQENYSTSNNSIFSNFFSPSPIGCVAICTIIMDSNLHIEAKVSAIIEEARTRYDANSGGQKPFSRDEKVHEFYKQLSQAKDITDIRNIMLPEAVKLSVKPAR